MRRKSVVILALVLVFALMFTACAVRRPLQTPVQTPQNTTGLYDNNRGIGAGTGTATGTGTYTGMGPSSTYRDGLGYGTTNNPGYGVNYRNFGMNNTGTATTQADTLARTVETVPGVRRATVVVSGNTAYVGVDTAGNITGNKIAYGTVNDVGTIKRQCAQKIKAANPQIQTVYVSTDANFLARLRKVAQGVKSGTAISSFRNELSGLVRGLVPERL